MSNSIQWLIFGSECGSVCFRNQHLGNRAAEGCQAKSEENQKDSPGAVIIPGSIVHGQILIAGFIGYYNRISLSKFDYNSHCSLWIE